MVIAPKWRELPTQLIREIGKQIGFKAWRREIAPILRRSAGISDAVLLGVLFDYVDLLRERNGFSPVLIHPAPAELTVEFIAKKLIEAVMLGQEGCCKSLAGHFSECAVCRLTLVMAAEHFLDALARLVEIRGEEFYVRLVLVTMKEVVELAADSLPPEEELSGSSDPAFWDNFHEFLNSELKAVYQRGEVGRRPFPELVREAAYRAAGLSEMLGHAAENKPKNPSDN